MLRKIISLILCFSFSLTQSGFAQGVAELNLGQYLGQMSNNLAVDRFRPLHLRYFSYDIKADNFQLLLDKGDNQDIKEAELQEKTKVLMEYFQIGLALPNDKFWVNLRLDAQDQIIDPELEKTDLGKIMLEADLQLKKDTAQWTSPQTPEGRQYWDKLYQKARDLFGQEPANIPTITRPWIVPGEIIVREGDSSAYIFKANLKVMLEEDYLRGTKDEGRGTIVDYNFKDPRMKELNEYSTQLIRELIIPKLTKEVNTAKRYAALRQVFFSLVLARWFKERFASQKTENREPRTEQINLIRLIDTGDLTNLTSKEAWSKSYYFNEYKKSFEKGEYNLKEQIATPTGQVIRSYVSGGMKFFPTANDINGFISSEEGFFALGGILRKIGSFFGFSWSKKGELSEVLLASSPTPQPLDKASYFQNFSDTPEEYKKEFFQHKKTLIEELSKFMEKRSFPWWKALIFFKSEKYWEGSLIKRHLPSLAELYNKVVGIGEKTLSLESIQELDKNIIGLIAALAKDKEAIDKKYPSEMYIDGLGMPWSSRPLGVSRVLRLYNQEIRPILDEYEKALDKLIKEGFFPSGSSPLNLEEEARRLFDYFENIFQIKGEFLEKTLADRELKFTEAEKTWNFPSLKNINELVVGAIGDLEDLLKEKESLTPEASLSNFIDFGKKIIQEVKSIRVKAEGEHSDILHDMARAEVAAFGEGALEEYGVRIQQEHEGKFKKYHSLELWDKDYLSDIDAFIEVLSQIIPQPPTEGKSKVSSPAEPKKASSSIDKFGGIDFRTMQMLIQPMGSFSNLNLSLPTLSSSALERIDLDQELADLRNMVRAGLVPSGARVKEYLAAVFQKGRMEEKQDDLLLCLAEICRLQEEEVLETSPELRESLVIVDTGRFVLLPNNQRAGLN